MNNRRAEGKHFSGNNRNFFADLTGDVSESGSGGQGPPQDAPVRRVNFLYYGTEPSEGKRCFRAGSLVQQREPRMARKTRIRNKIECCLLSVFSVPSVVLFGPPS